MKSRQNPCSSTFHVPRSTSRTINVERSIAEMRMHCEGVELEEIGTFNPATCQSTRWAPAVTGMASTAKLRKRKPWARFNVRQKSSARRTLNLARGLIERTPRRLALRDAGFGAGSRALCCGRARGVDRVTRWNVPNFQRSTFSPGKCAHEAKPGTWNVERLESGTWRYRNVEPGDFMGCTFDISTFDFL